MLLHDKQRSPKQNAILSRIPMGLVCSPAISRLIVIDTVMCSLFSLTRVCTETVSQSMYSLGSIARRVCTAPFSIANRFFRTLVFSASRLKWQGRDDISACPRYSYTTVSSSLHICVLFPYCSVLTGVYSTFIDLIRIVSISLLQTLSIVLLHPDWILVMGWMHHCQMEYNNICRMTLLLTQSISSILFT